MNVKRVIAAAALTAAVLFTAGCDYWVGDFEEGTLIDITRDSGGAEVNSGYADSSITTSIKHAGSYGTRLDTAASSGYASTCLFRDREVQNSDPGWFGAWYRFPDVESMDAGDEWTIMQLGQATAGEPVWEVRVLKDTSTTYRVQLRNDFEHTDYVPLTYGTWGEDEWVYIELYSDDSYFSGSIGEVRLRADGVTQTTVPSTYTYGIAGEHWSICNETGTGFNDGAATIFVDDARSGDTAGS